MPDYQKHGELKKAATSSGERGQAIVMVTFGVVFLMGILGLVVDVGWGYYRKQVAQAAVDSVVTAAVVAAGTGTITCGSGGVLCPNSSGGPITCSSGMAASNLKNGCDYGNYNGIAYSNMKINADVTTPISGVAVKYWVQANVSESILPSFLQVMGIRSGTVAASATGAVIASGSGTGGGCLYIMEPTAGSALNISSGSVSSTCGIYLNSSSATALIVQGSATVSTGGAPFSMVSGAHANDSGSGCKLDSFYTHSGAGFQCTDPTVTTAATDPLASVPAPTFGACGSSPNTTGGGTNYSWSNLTPAQTIYPGVYCGGINIGGGNVTLMPGNYILNGGGLRIQGGSNTTVTGNGVFFYNTNSGQTAGSLLLSSQTNVNLKAPTSGSYQGILFMQDHNVCPSTGHAINGSPTPNSIRINGTIYAHCTKPGSYVAQNLLFTGQSTAGYYMAMVVDTLTVNGATNLVLDPTGGSNTGIGLGSGNKPFLIQ